MNIKILLTISGLCLASVLYAQRKQDYVITMKGDTIVGKITSVKPKKLAIKTATSKMSFKVEEIYIASDNRKQKQYAPSRLGAAHALERIPDIEPEVYRISAKTKTKRPLFAEVIIDGEIAIYSFERSYGYAGNFGAGGVGGVGFSAAPAGGFTHTFYFAIKKSTGEIIKIKKSGIVIDTGKLKKKTVRDMAKLLEDEPEWLQRFEKEEKLSFDRLVDYIIGYNELRAARGYDAGRYNFQVF